MEMPNSGAEKKAESLSDIISQNKVINSSAEEIETSSNYKDAFKPGDAYKFGELLVFIDKDGNMASAVTYKAGMTREKEIRELGKLGFNIMSDDSAKEFHEFFKEQRRDKREKNERQEFSF